MKKTRIIMPVITALSAVFAFDANMFAASPCLGSAYEPEVPEKLRK